MTTDSEKILTRLGCIIPITLWPVMFFVQSQGTYSTGRHSAEALHAVGGLSLCIAVGLSGIGLLLIMSGNRFIEIRFAAIVFVLFNLFCVFGFIQKFAVAYA